MPSGKDLQHLDEPRAGRLNIPYAPDDTQVSENPPRFTWLPVIESEARYCLRISQSAKFPAKDTQIYTDIALNFFTLDTPLDAGDYHWSYAVCDGKTQKPITQWSKTRGFTVDKNLPQTPLPSRANRYKSIDKSRPRLWLSNDKIKQFRKDLAQNPNHCTWDVFFEKSVRPWMDVDVMAEPAGYPNHQRVAPIWRQTYIDLQELLYAIRHLAVGGKISEDKAMIARAKEWLLAAASWNPAGTTSRSYTDEWAFRVNLALAWGYDWLYDELSAKERATVRDALYTRTKETADHIIRNANIQLFPYDSHAVRAVSAVLIPASIALLDDIPEAQDWLDYSIDFLAIVYSPWGDADGGWAEGPHYWMTGMAYLIDAANLLKSFTDIDLYQRPFFQKTGDFALYTKSPDTRRATFGDDSTMGDLPSLKIGYNLRQFAGVTGNTAYQWYYDEIKRNDTGTEKAFYNWGWWDFNFDELVYQHDFDIITADSPSDIDKLRWFKGVGWVAIQHRMDVPNQHIQFVMKSSSFGSISHSHGDQNAFCLAGFGEDLAIQSGYYVAFNSDMHQNWRRQTRSKNAILINGQGQYAGKDKAKAIRSCGEIITAESRDDHIFIRGDATAAYQSLCPEITQVLRDVYFVNDSYFVFVDQIDATAPVEIDWLLHANAPMELGASSFRYRGKQAGFYGQFLWSEAGGATITQKTGFENINPEDYKGLPVSTCLNAKFPSATRQRIATLLVPYSLDNPTRIFSFLDDQGYDCDLYFTDAEERSFKVVVPKSFDVGR